MQKKYYVQKTHIDTTATYNKGYFPEVVVDKTEEQLAENITAGNAVQTDSAPPPYEESNQDDNEEEQKVHEQVEDEPQDHQEKPQSQDSQSQPEEDGIQPLSSD